MPKFSILVLILWVQNWASPHVATKIQQYAQEQAQTLLSQGKIHDGDLIFQSSHSRQAQAIQLATHSPFSHCGLISIQKGQAYVIEAVEPVKKTPLAQWIAHGSAAQFAIKRVKASQGLSPQQIHEVIVQASKMLGKPYDDVFGWSDDKIYCSELVWKAYQRGAHLELGSLQKLGDFDVKNPLIHAALVDKYGSKIPLQEKVISPAAIYNDSHLDLIAEGQYSP